MMDGEQNKTVGVHLGHAIAYGKNLAGCTGTSCAPTRQPSIFNAHSERDMSARIFWIGMLFGLLETWYFGCHWTPQSPAEVICDGITGLIIGMSILAMIAEGKSEIQK